MIVELLVKSQEKLSELPLEWSGMRDTCSSITERIARAFVDFWRGVFNGLPTVLGASSSKYPFKSRGHRLPSCPEKRMV